MSITDKIAVISLIIAGLGLILGIMNMFLYLREHTSILRVNPTITNRLLPTDLGISKEVPTLLIRLVNPTGNQITIKAVYILLETGQRIEVKQFNLMDWPQQPITVDARRDYDFIVRGKDFLAKLSANLQRPSICIKVIVRDVLDKEYKSKEIRFLINQLTEPELRLSPI